VHAHFGVGQAKLFGQTHGLTASMFENLRRFGVRQNQGWRE
jgi:hypothetical protein